MISITRKLPFVFFAWLLIQIGPAFSWPHSVQRGTTVYSPQEAFNCYILLCPLAETEQPEGTKFPVYLINMSGKVVHSWSVPFVPLQAKLLPNGNVIICGTDINQEMLMPPVRMRNTMGGYSDNMVELTWDGTPVFTHSDLNMHHDFVKLPNGNYLYLAWERLTSEQRQQVRGGYVETEFLVSIPEGLRKQFLAGKIQPGQDLLRMFNDYIVEVTPQRKKVWEWHAKDHLDPDIDIIGAIYRREEWLHCNSIAVLKDGNLLLTSRNTDSIFIVNRKTGKITFRWGNVASFNKEKKQLQYHTPSLSPADLSSNVRLGGPHDAHQIPNGLPGAGNFLLYNNGIYAASSEVIELDPIKRIPVWRSKSFSIGRPEFSAFMGGAQRLPNGNTLVCEGLNGRLFQVTKDHKTVWEYISPFDGSPLFRGALFKVHAYAPDYCPQFKGLPSAEGPAVAVAPAIPADQIASAKLAAAHAARQAAMIRIAVLLVSAIVIAALAFQIGRYLERRR